MGVSRLEDLRAWQLARAFKIEVYRLVRQSPDARRDYRFKSQLFEAAMGGESSIAEGWRRYQAGEMGQFLNYASASLEEATRRVQDGIDREYYSEEEARGALRLGAEAGKTTAALRTSLEPFMNRRRRLDPPPRRATRAKQPSKG
jgi:four helix bundle protein